MSSSLKNFETHEIVSGFANYVKHFPEYADYARELTNEAESYRKFDVAAVLVAIRPGDNEPVIFTGSNYTIDHSYVDPQSHVHEEMLAPEGEDAELAEIGQALFDVYKIPTHPDKNCAEMATLFKAGDYEENELKLVEEYPSLYAVGFVIAGPTDEQEIAGVTGVPTKTLPPCRECTEALHKSPITSRATNYASTGYSSNDPYEIRTIRDLQTLHNKGKEYIMHPKLSRMAPHVGDKAIKLFNARISHVQLPDKIASRVISSIARHALLEVGRTV